MTPYERQTLVNAWIEHHTLQREPDKNSVFAEKKDLDNFWAFETLDDICRTNPELAWELILEILRTPHSDSVTENLAAGPLEDLLTHFGSQLIEVIECTAATDPQLKELLGGVWQNTIEPKVWARIEACRSKPW